MLPPVAVAGETDADRMIDPPTSEGFCEETTVVEEEVCALTVSVKAADTTER